VFSRSVARANTVLMLHAASPLATADVARSAGLSYTPAESALETFERRGLAMRTRRAGRDRFGPNRDSLYYPMAYLTALVDLPVAHALREQHASRVYVYGPLAQAGGAARGIDLDLLVVGEIDDLAMAVAQLTLMGSDSAEQSSRCSCRTSSSIGRGVGATDRSRPRSRACRYSVPDPPDARTTRPGL